MAIEDERSTSRSFDRHSFAGVLRVGLAASIGAVAFIALREQYRGECLWVELNHDSASNWDTKQFVFLTSYGIVFVIAFVWFGAELGRVLTSFISLPRTPVLASIAGAVVALAVYSAIAVGVWQINPIPATDRGTDFAVPPKQLYLSALWPVGLLQRTGNYQASFCGQ